MKTHAIIPIFISHRGCPNDCVFCNQKKITARAGDVTPADVSKTVETWLTTLGTLEPQEIELAFFGGSFTGSPRLIKMPDASASFTFPRAPTISPRKS